MRYPAVKWRPVAILMRDSTYAVLEALMEGPKSWTELKKAAGLTDGGLQKVLKEMIRLKITEEILVKKDTGLKEKKYLITQSAKEERIYEKAKNLKESLDKVSSE